MIANPYGASAYRQASQNVGGLKAVVMLYDGMIRFVGEAKRADADGRFEDRYLLTEKASRIVIGLQGQLDFDNGGELSPVLSSFYDMLFMRMMQINSYEAQVVADDVLTALKDMRRAWEQVRTGDQTE